MTLPARPDPFARSEQRSRGAQRPRRDVRLPDEQVRLAAGRGPFPCARLSSCRGARQADVVLFNTCACASTPRKRVFSWLGELKAEKARAPSWWWACWAAWRSAWRRRSSAAPRTSTSCAARARSSTCRSSSTRCAHACPGLAARERRLLDLARAAHEVDVRGAAEDSSSTRCAMQPSTPTTSSGRRAFSALSSPSHEKTRSRVLAHRAGVEQQTSAWPSPSARR